jgi:hypothetical protein
MDLANDCLQIEKIIKNQPLYDNIQNRRLGPKIYNRAFELEILKILNNARSSNYRFTWEAGAEEAWRTKTQ